MKNKSVKITTESAKKLKQASKATGITQSRFASDAIEKAAREVVPSGK